MLIAKNVVITGSTKGIGKAMAQKLLTQGHNVVITSKSPHNVYTTYTEIIKDKNMLGQCYPVVADVSSYEECEMLMNKSVDRLGHIDIWINNAGVSFRNSFDKLSSYEIDTIVNTNLLGTLFCCRAVIPQMLRQQKGTLINVEGAGSNGIPTPEYSVYGATKSAITQFTRSISKEHQTTDIRFCTISPGMVITELLLHNADDKSKRVFNIFCESTDFIAGYLVQKIHAIKGNEHIKYLTLDRVLILLFMSFFRKNRFFDKDGNLI